MALGLLHNEIGQSPPPKVIVLLHVIGKLGLVSCRIQRFDSQMPLQAGFICSPTPVSILILASCLGFSASANFRWQTFPTPETLIIMLLPYSILDTAPVLSSLLVNYTTRCRSPSIPQYLSRPQRMYPRRENESLRGRLCSSKRHDTLDRLFFILRVSTDYPAQNGPRKQQLIK